MILGRCAEEHIAPSVFPDRVREEYQSYLPEGRKVALL
jgi:hypothetical protein